MAENPEHNMYNFNLSFQSRWNPPKLVRKGRRKDPLYKRLRVKKVINQYERSIIDDNQPGAKKYDFAVDEDGIIIHGLSNGTSNMYPYISIYLSVTKWTKCVHANRKYRAIHICGYTLSKKGRSQKKTISTLITT